MKPRKEKQNALSKVETPNVVSAAVLNATTRKAIAELEAGKGKRFTSVDALMTDLIDG